MTEFNNVNPNKHNVIVDPDVNIEHVAFANAIIIALFTTKLWSSLSFNSTCTLGATCMACTSGPKLS